MYDPTFDCEVLDLYRQAVDKGRIGQTDKAIALLEEVAREVRERGGEGAPSCEFLTMTHLAIAAGHLELGNAQEAVACLVQVAPIANDLGATHRFSYLLALGNAYGFLGRLPDMEWCLKSAMALAVRDLADVRRAERCWQFIWRHTAKARAWDALAAAARAGSAFARKHRLVNLGTRAQEQLRFAASMTAGHDTANRFASAQPWWQRVLAWIA